MLVYMCKYAPIEILEAFDSPVMMMEPNVTNFTQADTLMHANMCSFVKAILEDFEENDYEGMLFTTCCDSSRRLYDTLKARYPDKFFFCLDLPRKVTDFSVSLYEKQLQELIDSYSAFSGRTFDPQKLAAQCREKYHMLQHHHQLTKDYYRQNPEDLRICLAGARPGSEIKELIKNHGVEIALDLSCTGIDRGCQIEESNLLNSYARGLLTQLPCMRMVDVESRDDLINNPEDPIDGIIYHTIKFCDIYSYEYTHLKKESDLPVLKIETDATSQCAGQILTRVEAFLESLRSRKGRDSACSYCMSEGQDKKPRLNMQDIREDNLSEHRKETAPMYVLGIDSGSTSTNAVIMNEKKEILASAVVRTGAKSGESADRILAEVLEKANLKREDISTIVSTGYGRVSIPFADQNVTEISCHGRGAHFLNPSVRTILDIGGQDSKAIRLDENGHVIDFVMNDKCAAGTGRFLEMMARSLEISLDQLGPVSLQAKETIQISSMCSVFAESEVISLIAQNKETADIAKGIHNAIAGKAISLMKRVGLEPGYMMTGGVAKNPGMVAVLKEQLNADLFIYEEPEIVGAIGAALYALE